MSSNMFYRKLKQDVTFWAAVSDGFGGYTYSAPVTIRGRWEAKVELFRNVAGDELQSESVVYLSADVDEGDYIFLGTSVAADPATPDIGAEQVRGFRKVPDLASLTYERKAFL